MLCEATKEGKETRESERGDKAPVRHLTSSAPGLIRSNTDVKV